MNRKQEELLRKEFPVAGTHQSITRHLYEVEYPCSMQAWNWTDEQMEKLAKMISGECSDCNDEVKLLENGNEDERDEWFGYFYEFCENCAVRMGMRYYEDMTDEEFKAQNSEWNAIC